MSAKSGVTTSNQSTLCAEDSPARTSPWLERVPDSLEPGQVFGSSTSESFASFGPDGWSSRTSLPFASGGSQPYSGAWPRAGTMRNGTAFQRSPLAPLTDVIASSSWRGSEMPTPTAEDGNRGRNTTRQGGLTLSDKAVAGLLPTPSAQSYGSNQGGAAGRTGPVRHSLDSMAKQGLLPSPDTGVYRTAWKPGQRRGTLTDPTHGVVETGGQLHPRFCEWMMGFESEWTTVETGCDALVMPSSQPSRSGLVVGSSKRRKRGGQRE